MGNVLYKFELKVSTLLKFHFQITVAITNVNVHAHMAACEYTTNFS